ncbi:MAG TPA: crotonase, partial [Gammaproteobacteria bacterium]|nr:crotonase [Gammaproteobacteria bacterium]
FEDADAKRALYAEIEPRLREDAVLATNTSSIPLEALRRNLQRPERLVGLHFFNPVAKMQLVEIVRDGNTDPVVVNRAIALARRIDRLPLPVTSTPGFLVNRILMPYLLEAVQLESEGVPAEEIDRQARAFGMPMGPVELADKVGLDICLHVAENLGRHFGAEVPQRLRALVERGQLGCKSGQGFYRYRKGKAVHSRRPHKHPYNNDIIDRMILRMLNEAVACLRERVVEEADHLDAGMIFGTGFAPFRGGPVHYIETVGADSLLQRLRDLQQRFGGRFTPDAGWESLAGFGKPEPEKEKQEPA